MGKWSKTPAVQNSPLVCGTCGKDLGKLEPGQRSLGIYANGGPVFHCDGRSYAFGAKMWDEPHHNTQAHPACWKCGYPLGCRTCSGIEAELMCLNGSGKTGDGRWYGHGGMGPVVQRVAFIQSGPLMHQDIADYPDEWQTARKRHYAERVTFVPKAIEDGR